MQGHNRHIINSITLLLVTLMLASCSEANLAGSSQSRQADAQRGKGTQHSLDDDDPADDGADDGGDGATKRNGIDDYPAWPGSGTGPGGTGRNGEAGRPQSPGNGIGNADGDGLNQIPGKGIGSDDAGGSPGKGQNPGDDGGAGQPGTNGNPGDSTNKGKAGELVEASEASCLLDKAEHYRILLVMDSSGSTGKTDPTNIRRQAALQLTAQFTDYVTANPTASVDLAIIDFSETARIGASGWVRLTQASKPKLEQDITTATETPGKGTFFDQGVGAAADLFSNSSPVDASKRQRNFMLFLSDGQANGPKNQISDIAPVVTELAKKPGVAVFSILIGTKPDNKAADMMQALALPVQGIVAPDHVGSYFYAPNAETIKNAFQSFFRYVANCKK